MRAHGIEVEAECFDLVPIMRGGCNGDGMAAAPQFERDGKGRVEIAERAPQGDDIASQLKLL